MRDSDAARYVESILIDALTLHARYGASIAHLAQSTDDGYPPTTSGSDTGGGGQRTIIVLDDDGEPEAIVVTSVEAAVMDGRPDLARVARDRIRHELVEAALQLKILTSRVTAWWIPGTEAGRHADQAARTSLDNLACPNHLAHGMYEMRAHQRRLCGWCYDTSIAKDDKGVLLYGQPPDRELIEARARLGRLNSRDYLAFRRRITERKAAARNRRTKNKLPA